LKSIDLETRQEIDISLDDLLLNENNIKQGVHEFLNFIRELVLEERKNGVDLNSLEKKIYQKFGILKKFRLQLKNTLPGV